MNTLVQMDGDEHRALRGIVSQAFTPRNVRKIDDWMDGVIKDPNLAPNHSLTAAVALGSARKVLPGRAAQPATARPRSSRSQQ